MTRSKEWRRYKDYTKARRKQAITESWGWCGWPYYSNLHQYSKNKIHCSCAMCRNKTKNKGAAALFNGTYNYTHMDKRRLDSMQADKEEYFNGETNPRKFKKNASNTCSFGRPRK